MIKEQSKQMHYEELSFLKIHDRAPLFLPQLKSFDAVIIEYSHWLATKEMIDKIRTHNDEAIYLIPLFIHKVYDEGTKPNILVDGVVYSLNDLSTIATRTRQIKQQIY